MDRKQTGKRKMSTLSSRLDSQVSCLFIYYVKPHKQYVIYIIKMIKQIFAEFCKKILFGFGFGTGMGVPYYLSRNTNIGTDVNTNTNTNTNTNKKYN